MSVLVRNEVEMTGVYATVLGFLAASILPAAYLAVVHPLSGERDLQSVAGSLLVFYYFAAAITAILGIPTFLLLNKLRLVTWWSAIGGGALIGGIGAVILTSVGSMDSASLLRLSMLGGASGFLFWIIWRTGHTTGV
jgi:hypothetical protein